ncbi:MAG: hypothetical protein RLZZ341_1153 [Pseudomonadota bacterium]
MDTKAAPVGFPLPSELPTLKGAEQWASMYPYYTRFRPEDDGRFWFYNGMHFPGWAPTTAACSRSRRCSASTTASSMAASTSRCSR